MKRVGYLLAVAKFIAALLSCLPASAQDKVMLVGVPLGVSVETSLGMQSGTSPATDNYQILTNSFANSGQLHSVYFPGKVWGFSKTPVATNTGRQFVGNGIARLDGGDGFGANNGTPSKLAWLPLATAFNGIDPTASATGITPTITLSGSVSAASQDVFHTVDIAAGGNWVAGKYNIISVDTGANSWTLDRDCTIGSASAMVGSRKGTLWRDDGLGNVYRGLFFRGSATYNGTPTPTTRAAVLWHQRPYVQGVTPNTGKVVMENCAFANADVGILLGKGLANFGTPQQEYDGEAASNADNFSGYNLHFQDVETAVAIRSGQSVANTFHNINFNNNVNTLFYVERGGKMNATGIWPSTGFKRGPTLLRVGGSGGLTASQPESPIVIDSCAFDAPGMDLKILTMDSAIGDPDGEITVKNVKINATHTDHGVATFTYGTGTFSAFTNPYGNAVTPPGESDDLSTVTLVFSGTSGSTYNPSTDTLTVTVPTADGSTDTNDVVSAINAGTAFVANAHTFATTNQPISTTVVIMSINDGDQGVYDTPIVTADNGFHVTLENCGPLIAKSIRLSNSSGGGFTPSVTLRGCKLWISDSAWQNPETVIDDDGSMVGAEVKFEGCTTASFARKFCRDGVRITGGPSAAGQWRTEPTGP